MMNRVRVSVGYLLWAHGPAAEDGHPPAVAIVTLCEKSAGSSVTLDISDPAMCRELRGVAGLYNVPAQCRDAGGSRAFLRAARKIMGAV